MLAAVLCLAQVLPGKGVCVVPAEAGRLRRERIACARAGSDHRRAFFHRTVDLRGQEQTVPVDDLRIGGTIANCDRHFTPFSHAQQRTGNLSVIGDGLDLVFGRGFKHAGRNLERDVRLRSGGRRRPQELCRDCHRGKFSKVAPCQHVILDAIRGDGCKRTASASRTLLCRQN